MDHLTSFFSLISISTRRALTIGDVLTLRQQNAQCLIWIQNRIVFLGHSMGGIVGPILASEAEVAGYC